MHIPESYRGREQAYIKHTLLRGYLEQLIMIIGQRKFRNIGFVDCFAGPWKYEGDDLADTSIGISLDIMKNCRNYFIGKGWTVPKLRALYIEKNRDSFARLENFLHSSPRSIESSALCGDFFNLSRSIEDWYSESEFVFFFIDPKGWKGISMPKLRPLLERPNSEFLINLMYDFVNRAVPQDKFALEMQELFGTDISKAVAEAEQSKDRERILLRLYQQRLCEAASVSGGQSYSSAVRVMNPYANRTKYYLVYLTRHPKGIKAFLDQSEKINIIQPQVRAEAQQNRRVTRTGKLEMFKPEHFPMVNNDDPKLDVIEAVKQYWLRVVTDEPKQFTLTDLALIHAEEGWLPSVIQHGLQELIMSGHIKNIDARGKRLKNFIDFGKNERLVRIKNPV